ncbi:M56 family metallopeptidase [Kribbella sp. DT2]|uniref:M56 family metallopeptidase n=1 Tax=Kribbella sp. DT2 TaxID=3393427 RepID=UPI003CE94C4F
MIVAFTLFGYAVLAATGGAALLRRATWPLYAPRLAIAAWLATGLSVLLAVFAGALSLAVRLHFVGSTLAELLQICITNLRSAYATPGGAVLTSLGLAIALFVSARAAWGIGWALHSSYRHRRRHGALIDLLGRRHPDRDLVVIDHPGAAAFCLPGRPRRVVVTSSALALLTADELSAVLAHERAHLHGRHHLIVAIAKGLRRSFPGLPIFVWGDDEISRLVEMAADDSACRNSSPRSVANALMLLAGGRPPAATLALGGHSTELRLRRLMDRRSAPLRSLTSVGLVGGIAIILAAPAILALIPAMVAAGMEYCGLT